MTNTSLPSLAGLESLRSVRYVVIAGNSRLTSLEGLEGLERAEGISVYNNPMLRDAGALDGLRELGALVVLGQTDTSFEKVARVTRGDVVIEASEPASDVDFDSL